jgi:hypothetical protein
MAWSCQSSDAREDQRAAGEHNRGAGRSACHRLISYVIAAPDARHAIGSSRMSTPPHPRYTITTSSTPDNRAHVVIQPAPPPLSANDSIAELHLLVFSRPQSGELPTNLCFLAGLTPLPPPGREFVRGKRRGPGTRAHLFATRHSLLGRWSAAVTLACARATPVEAPSRVFTFCSAHPVC